ncbi:hypothetical protein FB45DRAFT_471578 [Roridomyces roridus]|uniref:Uncharacterized protein n=1 Tax=Roridomyces roridus TaxID=1738132 RepID=A0AAD7FRT4_9AGAR|nr:hypothetical protein FB45DRAFT_471578 [Roridomyces roridus]
MKARILCHNGPPGDHHHPNSTLGDHHHQPNSTLPPPPHHPQWQHCEIIPEGHHHFKPPGPLGATLFGIFLGILICAIPLFVLARKVRRMKKMLKRGGPGGGGMPHFRGGHRWFAGGDFKYPDHGHHHHHHNPAFNPAEAEQLLEGHIPAPDYQ